MGRDGKLRSSQVDYRVPRYWERSHFFSLYRSQKYWF
jgi:hypothetical protein